MKKILKWLAIVVLLVLLLAVVGLVLLNFYLASDDEKVIHDVPGLNGATLSFHAAHIDLFSQFPLVAIELNDVSLTDSLFKEHENKILEAQEISLDVTLKDLLQKKIEIQAVQLRNGSFILHTDENCYNNLKSIFPIKADTKANDQAEKKSNWYDTEVKWQPLPIEATDFYFQIYSTEKKRDISGYLNQLKTELSLEDKLISASGFLDVELDQLAFNWEKGKYLRGQSLEGNFDFQHDGDSKLIEIDCPNIKVGTAVLSFQAEIEATKGGEILMEIESKETNYEEARVSLNDKLQKALSNYNVFGPFYSKTKLFKPKGDGKKMEVDIQFETKGNTVRSFDYHIDNTYLAGDFSNKFDRTLDFDQQVMQGLNFYFEKGRVEYQGMIIETKDATLAHNKDTGIHIKTFIEASGKSEALGDFFGNDQFLFRKGDFIADLEFDGIYEDNVQLALESSSNLYLRQFEMYYLPADISIPINELALFKSGDDSLFEVLANTLGSKYPYKISGSLKNFPALILNNAPGRTITDVHMKAEHYSWIDFIALFAVGEKLSVNRASDPRERTASLKKLLLGVQENFSPSIAIEIDTLTYSEKFELYNFSSGVHFEEEVWIVLEDTHFGLEDGRMDLFGKVNVSDPLLTAFEISVETDELNVEKIFSPFDYFGIQFFKDLDELPSDLKCSINQKGVLEDHVGLLPNTSEGELDFEWSDGDLSGKIIYGPDLLAQNSTNILGDTKIELFGKTELINDYFKNDDFFFLDGDFHADLRFQGDIRSSEDLLSGGRIILDMDDFEFFYKTVGVVVPLEKFLLEMDKGDAELFVYTRPRNLSNSLQIAGTVKNADQVFLKDEPKGVFVDLKASGEKLIWDEFLFLFSESTGAKNETRATNSVDATSYTTVDETNGTNGVTAGQATNAAMATDAAAFKKTARGMLNTFHPTLELDFDTIRLSDQIELYGFNSQFKLQSENVIGMNKIKFRYREAPILMKATIDIGNKEITPFETSVKMGFLDLNGLLNDFNHFGIQPLRDIEKIEGDILLEGYFNATLIDTMGILPATMDGFLYFELPDLRIRGYEPLEKIASRLFRLTRFQDIDFAAISNEISIKGTELEVPLMEVQSSAFNFFVEGIFSYENKTNIWVSMPLNNLRKRKLGELPAKQGYAESGPKVYVEVFSNDAGKTKFRFRLRKKKFYQKRGIEEQYRVDKKGDRKERRAARKKRRLMKKNQKTISHDEMKGN